MLDKKNNFVSFCIFIVILISFYFSFPYNLLAQSPPGSNEPVVIGALWDLSGPDARLGLCALQAARQAVNDINSQGGINGRPLKLYVADTAGLKKQLLAGARVLLYQKHVLAILGPTHPELITTLWNFCSIHQVPLILTCGDKDVFPLAGRSIYWVFSVSPPRSVIMKAIYKAITKQGFKRVGILVESTKKGEDASLWLKGYGLQYNIKLVGINEFASTDTDMTPQLKSLLAQGAQVVICWIDPSRVGYVCQSAILTGATIALPLCDFNKNIPFNLSELDMVSALPPILAPSLIDTNSSNYVPVSIFSTQVKINLEDVGPSGIMASGCAWDAINLFTKAALNTNYLTRADIRESLQSFKEPYVGVMGTFLPYRQDHCGLEVSSLLAVHWYDGIWHKISSLTFE